MAGPVGGLDVPERVGRRVEVGLDFADLVTHRVVLVLAGERTDVAVEGRREEDRLAVLGDQVEELAHLRQESHVGHAVGFVDDDDLDAVELDGAALDQVDESARAGDEDVDAAAQLAHLGVVADTAVDRDHAPTAGLGERQEILLDLGGKLTRRGEDEPARTQAAGARDALDHRDPEGEGLARAGRGPARDVAPGERVDDGGRLDGERLGDVALLERVDEVGGHAEIGKAD